MRFALLHRRPDLSISRRVRAHRHPAPKNTADARPRRAPTRLLAAADACIDLALRSRKSIAATVDFAGSQHIWRSSTWSCSVSASEACSSLCMGSEAAAPQNTGCLSAIYLIYADEAVGRLKIRLNATFKRELSACTHFLWATTVQAKSKSSQRWRQASSQTYSRTHHHPQQPPRQPRGKGRWSRRVVSPQLSLSIRCTGSL